VGRRGVGLVTARAHCNSVMARCDGVCQTASQDTAARFDCGIEALLTAQVGAKKLTSNVCAIKYSDLSL